MKKINYGNGEIEFDELAPCICCGEPVHDASMGGTLVCPACDCGRCRFCKVGILVLKESVDGGKSKRNIEEHMKKHREELGLPKVYTEEQLHKAVIAEIELRRKSNDSNHSK